jgi:hypothetical protein
MTEVVIPRPEQYLKEIVMFTKSLIVAAAVAASLASVAPVEQASAKTRVFVNVGLGFGGGFYPGYGYGYGYDAGYVGGGVSCWKGKRIVEWAGFHNVSAYDCSGPLYAYKARKFGDWYKVRVNWHGDIVGVKHI